MVADFALHGQANIVAPAARFAAKSQRTCAPASLLVCPLPITVAFLFISTRPGCEHMCFTPSRPSSRPPGRRQLAPGLRLTKCACLRPCCKQHNTAERPSPQCFISSLPLPFTLHPEPEIEIASPARPIARRQHVSRRLSKIDCLAVPFGWLPWLLPCRSAAPSPAQISHAARAASSPPSSPLCHNSPPCYLDHMHPPLDLASPLQRLAASLCRHVPIFSIM